MKGFNWLANCSYNHENKEAFHRQAKRQLRLVAKALGLEPGSFDLRSNKAGIAVSGEVTLHGEGVYVQVGQSCMGPQSGILYRSCKGRKDYHGGGNNFAALNELDDPVALAAKVGRVMEGLRPGAERFQLLSQSGHFVGPEFSRYQDAFNHRAAINGVGLRVVEVG